MGLGCRDGRARLQMRIRDANRMAWRWHWPEARWRQTRGPGPVGHPDAGSFRAARDTRYLAPAGCQIPKYGRPSQPYGVWHPAGARHLETPGMRDARDTWTRSVPFAVRIGRVHFPVRVDRAVRLGFFQP